MFLRPFWSPYRLRARRRAWYSLGCLVLVGLSTACSLAQPKPCSLELPTYDPQGNRIEAWATGVNWLGDRGTDLLRDRSRSMSTTGDRIVFPKSALGRSIEVTMKTAEGKTFKARLELTSCKQRASLRYGQLDRGLDVAWSSLRGRIVGCPLIGDWWVRAMPMYGGYAEPSVYEGYIDTHDGSLLLEAAFRGERHIVIIGKGKDPVRAFGVNLVVGADNDIGAVDLTGSCPK